MSLRPHEDVLLLKEASDSLSADLVVLRQEADTEAQASNLTPAEKAVLLGHLVENAVERATFLGLKNSPLARTEWVRKELGMIFPSVGRQNVPAIDAQAVDLKQEDNMALSADIALLQRDVNEAYAGGNMTTLGKTVLLGFLTQNHIERATFLGLRSSPLTRAKWVEERLAKKFPSTK